MYIHRVIESTVRQYLKSFPVVGITGPRQSGKSTMLQQMLGSKYQYVTFDNLDYVAAFQDDPNAFMQRFNDRIIFDEVQRVPDLFIHIKANVDNDRKRYGKFIVTGSAQFAMMKGVSESLAGRIGLLSLLPFQLVEMPPKLRAASIYRGSYPELTIRRYKASKNWYSSYLDTYLTRDVRAVREIGDMRDFRNFIRLLASRVSQIVNLSTFASDVGVSVPTIKKWLSVLEASYIVFLLPPYLNNLGARIIKSPKLYFYDTGLVSFLTGVQNKELFEKGPLLGQIFENYIISEVQKRILHRRSDAQLFYLRTSNRVEIDLIIENGMNREFIEIKAGSTYKSSMSSAITKMKGGADKAIVLYRGGSWQENTPTSILNFADYLSR